MNEMEREALRLMIHGALTLMDPQTLAKLISQVYTADQCIELAGEIAEFKGVDISANFKR